MEDNILRSVRPERRNPFLSLLMSLGVPGLGQLYNGEGLKGIVIALCSVIPLLLAPLPAMAAPGSGIFTVFVLFGIGIMVRIYACIDAPVVALLKKTLIPGRTNIVAAYLLFTLPALCATLMAVAALLFMFTMKHAPDARMDPTIAAGDVVLVSRFKPAGHGRGDAVLVETEGMSMIARVIGLEGDSLVYEAGSFLVNGSRLSTGIMSDDERNRMEIANRECLFYESDGSVKYPVCIRPETVPVKRGVVSGLRVDKDMVLVAYDNRNDGQPYRMVAVKDIRGGIVGIIMGSEPHRSFIPVVMDK